MDQRLRKFEARRIAARASPPDLQQALLDAYARLHLIQSPHFEATNARIIDQLSAEERISALDYHNCHHAQDVIDAATLLLTAGSGSSVSPQEMEALLTAALGHDLHHDGRAFLPDPELECRSARSVTAIGRDCGVPENALVLIEALILGTYPALQKVLRTEGEPSVPTDTARRLKLILGEADVLASLTPRLGRELSISLAKEWASAGMHVSHSPSSAQGRQRFLVSYQKLSAEAEALGVAVMIAQQLNHRADDHA